ncbi:MAG TPA: PIN domain-containing protein [Terriglobales bacterium]|nr:PIN domain-containing protein [Terriglobales bacterium]
MSEAFAVDSSCMVAAVCSWHEQHTAAFAEIERRLTRGERMVVPIHALTEAYSVLTRLPAPHRLSCRDAWAVIEANFVHSRMVVALDASEQVKLLARLAADAWGGGRTYDAVIAASATRGKAAELLTFNPRHFEPALDGISIVVPCA